MLWLLDRLAGRWLDLRAKHTARRDGHENTTQIKDVEINEDGLTVTGMSPAIAVLADQAAAMLDFHNAQNYVEFDMYPRADRGLRSIRVTVAWANGEMPSAKCARLESEKRQLLYTFWNILDGIIKQGDGDTLWADEGTTAHEALVEVAAQYDPEVANEFQQRLENAWSEDAKPEDVGNKP